MVALETAKKPALVWQGPTLDSYTLQLTGSGLERIISQLPKQLYLKNLVKINYNGNLKQAVVCSIAQLVQDALYIGSVSNPKFSKQLRVFEAQDTAGRNYQIFALPKSNQQSVIVGVRADSQVEGEYLTKDQIKQLKNCFNGAGIKSGHHSNKRGSTKDKHQKADTRRRQDQWNKLLRLAEDHGFRAAMNSLGC